jgi:hypothetical protein
MQPYHHSASQCAQRGTSHSGDVVHDEYCYPGCEGEGPDWVACDNVDDPKRACNDIKDSYFHIECVGLTDVPKGKWVCPACAAQTPEAKSRAEYVCR